MYGKLLRFLVISRVFSNKKRSSLELKTVVELALYFIGELRKNSTSVPSCIDQLPAENVKTL